VAAMSDNEAFFCGTHTWHFNGTTITALSTTNTAYSMDMFDDGLGWVIDNYGEIDGFVSLQFPWVRLHPKSDVEFLYDIDSPNGKDVWAVGAYGLIRHSPNGDDFYINSIPYDWGNNTLWNTHAAGITNTSLTKVFFTSPLNGYAVGDNGAILKYSLLEGAPEGAEILGISIPGQVGQAIISKESRTVYVEVPPSADLTKIIPEIFLSAGATAVPPGGVVQNFTNPVQYTVTASDATTKTWTVTVVHSNAVYEEPGPEFEVFPNPTAGKFRIQNSEFKIDKVEVVDLFRNILTAAGKLETREAGMEFDIGYLPAGVYFIRISVSNSLIVKKIVKL
jgi:hypothetical protein